ncbi:putative ATP-binding protein [Myroides odoratimimus]|uniref:AAA family ATPase n=1 Tax=Myroides odoratimimus TaxID=76832 RepID=UPI000726F091|nr:AAA family ATPase [Myroides odoratimimus]GAQ15692.1 putative ATP-binding protein [Myroides odoratimimus]STZ49447.1 Predicted ATP-binding protein involved in virulence [Myroides odoratimimus]
MFFFFFDHYSDLTLNKEANEDVNILVGVNGVGKSTTLNELAKFHIKNKNNVIVISNTIYDKFSFRGSPTAHKLKSNYGKSMLKNVFDQVLLKLTKNDSKIIENIRKILQYIRFELEIGLSIKGLHLDYERLINECNEFERDEKNDIIFFINMLNKDIIARNSEINNVYRLNLDSSSFKSMKDVFYLNIIRFEKKLKKLKVLKRIDIVLYKDSQSFSLNEGSSGELSLIASLFFVSLHIKENSIVLIDEPENSLHPKWQVEYVKQFLDLFHLYKPKIILATHSPLIINGAEVTTDKLNIFKGNTFRQFRKKEKELKNVEEIYEDYFDITTPENRYISQYVVNKLNALDEQKITNDDFENDIEKLILNSYDEVQIDALKQIIEVSREISSN